jgi:hypothetical protein
VELLNSEHIYLDNEVKHWHKKDLGQAQKSGGVKRLTFFLLILYVSRFCFVV